MLVDKRNRATILQKSRTSEHSNIMKVPTAFDAHRVQNGCSVVSWHIIYKLAIWIPGSE